jgi:hypothetical protein
MTDYAQRFKAGTLCRLRQYQKLWLLGLPYNDAENVFPKHSVPWERFRDLSWTAWKYSPAGTIVMVLRELTFLERDFGFMELLVADSFVGRMYFRPDVVDSPDHGLELVEP